MVKSIIAICLLLAQGSASELGSAQLSAGTHETLIENMLVGNRRPIRPVMAWLNGEHHTKAEYSLLQRHPEDSFMETEESSEESSEDMDMDERPVDYARRGGVTGAKRGRSHSRVDNGPVAEIYPDVTSDEKIESGATAVELTRFVTPYRVGMDKFVDVTKFAPLFDAAETEHKIILHKIANCTQCGIDWCNAGYELEEKNVEEKAYKVGDRLSKWTCEKLHAGPVRKPWKNSETGTMYVAEALPILTMYGMIDTWVSSNDTKTMTYYQNNENITKKKDEKCYEKRTDDGQGWLLSADLIFFHGDQKQAVKPKEVVSLASGYFSTVGMGSITDHQAKITPLDKKVHLDKAIELTGAIEAVVYGCKEGPGKILENAIATYIARKSELEWQKDGNGIKDLQEEFTEFLIGGELHSLTPVGEHSGNHTFVAKYDPATIKAEKDMPVYYQNVITEDYLLDGNGKKRLWNMSFPFKPAGKVITVDTLAHKIVVQMNHQCYPTPTKNKGVKIAIPSSAKAFQKVEHFVQDAMDLGKLQAAVDFGSSHASDQERFMLPVQDRVGKLKLPHPLPLAKDDHALPSAVPVPASGHPIVQQIFEIEDDSDRNDAEAGNACVVVQRKHGQVVRKKFTLPMREAGDRVLANIAVTGHGWSYTQEQCGEYCDIMYSLKFNNGQAINLTQWRGDCKDNPIKSHGTWDESRNGWCPGTVEPGAIVDITDHLTPVTNGAKAKSPVRNDGVEQTVTLDVLVFSEDSGKYEPFSNIKGWIFGDKSILKIELSLHVYARSTYAATMNKFIRCSSAEAAMHHEGKVYGDETPWIHEKNKTNILSQSSKNMPKQKFKEKVDETDSLDLYTNPKKRSLAVVSSEELLDASTTTKKPKLEIAVADKNPNPWNYGASCWQFKKTAPWYETYNIGVEDLIAKGLATRVKVLDKEYMQSTQRYTTVPIYLDVMKDKDFSQVGLQMKLEKPDGLEYDHWDRVGSVGLEYYKSTASARMHSKSEANAKPLDNSLVDDAAWAGAHGLTVISGLLVALLAYYA